MHHGSFSSMFSSGGVRPGTSFFSFFSNQRISQRAIGICIHCQNVGFEGWSVTLLSHATLHVSGR